MNNAKSEVGKKNTVPRYNKNVGRVFVGDRVFIAPWIMTRCQIDNAIPKNKIPGAGMSHASGENNKAMNPIGIHAKATISQATRPI